MIYLDTSALIKLYLIEEGSREVNEFIVAQDDALPIWELQEAEFVNALRLKVFRKELGEDEANVQIRIFKGGSAADSIISQNWIEHSYCPDSMRSASTPRNWDAGPWMSCTWSVQD